MGKQLDHTSHDIKGKFSLSILAHQLKSPYNLGVIFRLTDALGVKKLYLSGDTILPPNRKISKTSRSTEKSVYYEQVDNIQEFIQNLKNDGVLIVALELCDNSIPIEEIILPDNAEGCQTGPSESPRGMARITRESSAAPGRAPQRGGQTWQGGRQATAS